MSSRDGQQRAVWCPGCRAIAPIPTGPASWVSWVHPDSPSRPVGTTDRTRAPEPCPAGLFPVPGDDGHEVQALSELTEACGPPLPGRLSWAEVMSPGGHEAKSKRARAGGPGQAK